MTADMEMERERRAWEGEAMGNHAEEELRDMRRAAQKEIIEDLVRHPIWQARELACLCIISTQSLRRCFSLF